MPIRRMWPQECISLVDGDRPSFLAANALAICALEQQVWLDENGTNGTDLAERTAKVLQEVSNEMQDIDAGYALDLADAASALSHQPVHPHILFCASMQFDDALRLGRDGRVEVLDDQGNPLMRPPRAPQLSTLAPQFSDAQ
jgi:hypothetical protein